MTPGSGGECGGIETTVSTWPRTGRRWAFLAGAVLLLAVASQVRQNGIIVAFVGAIAVGWIAGATQVGLGRRLRRGLAWGVGGFLAVAVTGQTLTTLSIPPHSPPDPGVKTGLRIVQNYDLIGAAALDPHYKLSIMSAADPVATAMIAQRAPLEYSGRRVDFIDRDQALTDALWNVPAEAANRQWVDLILRHPALYLRVRWEDFRWVFAPPAIDWCLPIYVGVDAPANKMDPLKL